MQYVLYLLISFCAVSSQLYASTSAPTALCITIQPNADSVQVCQGATLLLQVEGGSDYSWFPADDFNDPTADSVVLTASASQWYYVTGMGPDSACIDSIYVQIIEFAVTVSTTDTICPLDIVNVTFTSSGTIDSIAWNTTAGVEDSFSTSGTEISPLETTEYIVTAFVAGCTLSDTLTIDVMRFEYRLSTPDTLYLCLDDSIQILHGVFPVSVDIVWEPLDSTIRVESPFVATVKPTVSTTYTSAATFGECVLTTVTFVRVDSIPDTLLTVIPLKDPYCAGESVTILAEHADTMKYPDILFDWFPKDGQITDSTNTGNVYVTLQDTTTFLRIVSNNACIDTSRITLNVIPPDLPLSVMDTTLCPGDMFMVEVLDPEVSDIEWTPSTGLSCDDCLNPTVTVSGPQVYMVSAMKDRCTVSGMLNVQIYPPYQIPVTPASILACPGDMIQFDIDLSGLTNVNISVTGNGSVSCNDCPNPIVTYNGGTVQLIVTADEMFDNFCGTMGGATIVMNQNLIYDIPISVSDTRLCPGDIAELMIDTANLSNLNITVSGSGSLSCNNCPNPLLTYNGGTVVVNVTADENLPGFCGAMGSLTFTLRPDSVAVRGVELFCPGIATPLPLAGFINPVYQILGGGGTVACNNCGLNPQITLNSPDTLQITSDSPGGGECQLITKIPLNFWPDDPASIVTSPSADSIHQGEIIAVSVIPPLGSNYQWKVNGLAVNGSTSTVDAPFDEKMNVVMVQWTNSRGCVQTLMTTIEAQDPEYRIPNAFTPGNTETNTHFRVLIEGNYDLVQLLVFNRWGQVVYDGNDDIGWDGDRNGEPAPPEVYTYIAKLRAPSGRIITDKGDVTLIR